VALEDGATGTTVGGVRVVTFKGGAQSRQRLTGVSDVKRSLSYEDIENAEVVSAVAASETTITLTRITQSNQTLVAWARDFSSDVTGQNIIDAQDGTSPVLTGSFICVIMERHYSIRFLQYSF
jgi:hypothetical protein